MVKLSLPDEISFHFIFSQLAKGRNTLLLTTVIAVVIAFVSLPFQAPSYTVSMSVIRSPSAEDSGAGAALRTAGGLSSLLSLGADRSDNYDRYQKLLTSLSVADRLAKRHGMLRTLFSDQWDGKTKQWHNPAVVRPVLVGWLLSLAHVPVWVPPDSTQLATVLEGKVEVKETLRSDIVTISMDSTNPQLAQKLLYLCHIEANNVLRDQIAKRAKEQAAYLRLQLAQVNVEDYRMTLLNLLAVQEKTLMLTSNTDSFAAQMLNPPTVYPIPTSPRPILMMVIAALFGAAVGAVVVVFLGPLNFPYIFENIRRLAGGVHPKLPSSAPDEPLERQYNDAATPNLHRQ